MAYDLTARLRLIDNMTAPLRRVMSSFKQTDSAVKQVTRSTNLYRDANGKLRNENGRFVQENKKLAGSFGILGGSIGKLTGLLSGLAIGTTAVGIAYSSLNKAMEFEAQMSTIQALTGASAEEMQRMNDLAMKMGAQTKYSALEAAQGIEELLKAGLTPAAVEAGGLENALNLATAGGLGLADAAEIMSTALNAYKRDALTATDAANILAGTANASATGVMDLRYSLAAVSAVAAGVGMSFRDTNTALGLFANNGLKGSDAGTSLKTMLSNLQPTTKQQITLFKRLGIITKSGANQFYGMNGQLKSLDQIADILRKSLDGMTDQQRMLALETMFGSDAIRAATILYHEGADGVREFQREMSKVTALDVAKQKMDNAKGAIEQFQGALETIQISALQPLLPVIKDMALLFADIAEEYGPQITATFEEMGKSIREFLDPYLNDPSTWKVEGQAELKFKQLEMLDRPAGPPPFWENLMGRFEDWYNATGRQMLENGAATIAKDFAKFLEDNGPTIVNAAMKIGGKVALSVVEGYYDGMRESWFGQTLHAATPAVSAASGTKGLFDWMFSEDTDGSHYNGISYVPRDGYRATLHEGERVLTKQENREYESGRKGGVNITGNTFVVNAAGGDLNDPKVVDTIALQIARQIQSQL